MAKYYPTPIAEPAQHPPHPPHPLHPQHPLHPLHPLHPPHLPHPLPHPPSLQPFPESARLCALSV